MIIDIWWEGKRRVFAPSNFFAIFQVKYDILTYQSKEKGSLRP